MPYAGFTIPDEAGAFNASQSGVDALEWQALGASIRGYGVVSGCAVTAQGTADTTVAVASGSVQGGAGATAASVSAGNVLGFVAAAAGKARIDLVVAAYADGTKSRLAGAEVTPASTTQPGPVWPSAFDPTTYAVLAEVYCDENSATVVASHVIDKRLLVGTYVALSVLDTDGTLAANSDAKVATQKAVKSYADALIAANDAMVFKGVIDASTNPNYPAADRGHTYRISVAGKIGGASGVNVEAGDLIVCLTDGTASGTQAAVGSSWTVIQANLDGAVIGPASATDGHVVLFEGTTGKLIKDGFDFDTRVATTAVLKTGSTSTGEQVVPDLKVTGLTGAVTAVRFVGGTVSGPPTTGTFAAGDFVVTLAGGVWVCIGAGTPGTWVRPSARVVAEAHADASALNTAAETTLASLTLPGGTVAAGDSLRFVAFGDRLNNSPGTVTYTWRFKIGSTTVVNTGTQTLGVSAIRAGWQVVCEIEAAGTAEQRCSFSLIGTTGGGSPLPVLAQSAIAYGAATEDTTSDKAIALSVQLGTANANADAVLKGASLVVVKK